MLGIIGAFTMVVCFIIYLSRSGTPILRPAFYILSYIFVLIGLRLTTELAISESYGSNIIAMLDYSFYIMGVMFFVMLGYILWSYTTEAAKIKKMGEGYTNDKELHYNQRY